MVRWTFSKDRSEETIESSRECSSGVASPPSSFSSLSLLPKSSETRRGEPQKPLIASHALSMQIAAGLSTACFYPFDVVKTRYMSQDGTVARQHNGLTYRSMATSFAAIYRAEGARALFRGLPVTLVGATSAWGIYMWMYRSLCNWTDSSSYMVRSGLSLLSSLTSTFLTSPIFFIKSRMQLEEIIGRRSSTLLSASSQGLSLSWDSRHSFRTYATFRSGFKHILATNGICGLWKGISLQLILVFPYFLAFPTYDFFKSILVDYHLHCEDALSSLETKKTASGNLSEDADENTAVGTGFYGSWFSFLFQRRMTSTSAPSPSSPHLYQSYTLNLLEIAFCSGLTKIFLLILSHPMIMLRVRIQDQRAMEGDIHYDRIRKSFKTVLYREGVLGMYRGFVPSLVHVLPRGVVQYTVYELCLKCLTP